MAPRVVTLMFYEAGTYNDQFNAGFQRGLRDRTAVDDFMRATDDGRRVNATTVSSIANEILSIKSDVDKERPILIPNGWGEPRCAFVMVVETENYRDQEKFQVITGFTDRVDVSYRGEVAPDLELFINNITEFRKNHDRHRTNIFIEDNSFILRGQSSHLDRRASGRRRDEGQAYYLRPNDVFYHLSAPTIANRFGGGMSGVSDHRSDASTEFSKTRRAYNSPASFIADTVRAGIAGRRRNEERLRQPGSMDDDVDYMKYMDEQDSDSLAADMLIPRDTGKSVVMSRMMEITDFLRTGSVTIRELEQCLDFRDADVVNTTFSRDSRDREFAPGRRGESRELTGADLNTMSYKMTMAIAPSLFITHGVGEAILNMTNDSITGETRVVLSGVCGLVPGLYIDDSTIIALEEMFKFDLGNVISHNGYYRYNLKLHYSAFRNSRVTIWVDDRNCVDRFDSPTLADCLLSPQVTDENDSVGEIADEISIILETIEDVSRERSADNTDRKFNY